MSVIKTAGLSAPLRWWQYIGPWPLRPWVAFLGTGAVSTIAASAVQRESLLANPIGAFPGIFVPALLGSAALYGILKIASRYLPNRTPRKLLSYLLIIFFGAIVDALVTFELLEQFGVGETQGLRYSLLQASRIWVYAVLLLAIAGVTVKRLNHHTQVAENALAISREQQTLMLINEEKSRRQVSMLLHDRVQAGLMTACLELRLATAPGVELDRARIEGIIEKLDNMRGLDVRLAARTLSPDLANVDLHTALQELTQIYEPGMSVEIRIDPQITNSASLISTEALLACYRITEQGLLNAVVHGNSTQAKLELDMNESDRLKLSLTDNGRSVAGETGTPGFGSAIIDSWCRVMDGTWELIILSGEGARLSAQIPIKGESGRGLNEGEMSLL